MYYPSSYIVRMGQLYRTDMVGLQYNIHVYGAMLSQYPYSISLFVVESDVYANVFQDGNLLWCPSACYNLELRGHDTSVFNYKASSRLGLA